MAIDRFKELIERLRDFGDLYETEDYQDHYDQLDEWFDDYDDAPIEDEEETE